MDNEPYTDDLNLSDVSTLEALADLLQEVHLRADKPSLRTLQAKTLHSQTLLSKTTVSEMLRGIRLPRKAVMVAFLRTCGVPDAKMEPWQHAWDRVASRKGGLAPRRTTQVAVSRRRHTPASRRPRSTGELAARRPWQFADSAPLTIICAQLPRKKTGPLARPDNPNYTELLSYADLDALIDLYGHIRSENPTMDVFYKLSSEVIPDDMSSHVVILGGIAWNDKTERLSEMASLPVRQVEDPAIQTGEIFVLEQNGSQESFLPKWASDGRTLVEDVGLIVRTPNPNNSNLSLTICNGIHIAGECWERHALSPTPGFESPMKGI